MVWLPRRLQGLLQKALRRQYENLSPLQKMSLRRQLVDLHTHLHGQIPLATLCSGTDVLVHCFECLATLWLELFGLDFKVDHVMSCENVIKKRDWIEAHFKPAALFTDILNMGEPRTEDHTGKMTTVGPFQFLGSGVECDSISSLYMHASDNRMCIDQQEGKTGITAKGHFDAIRQHRPVFWFLENVKNLATKHKEVLSAIWTQSSFWPTGSDTSSASIYWTPANTE